MGKIDQFENYTFSIFDDIWTKLARKEVICLGYVKMSLKFYSCSVIILAFSVFSLCTNTTTILGQRQ